MKIRELRTADELHSLANEWDKLLGARGEDVLASNFLWASTWWAHLGRNRELRVLIAEESNQIVGIAPLCAQTIYRKNLAPVKVRCFIGDGLSDYGCILAGDDRDGICAAFLGHLQKKRDWHELRLHNIPDTTGDFERLCRAGARLGFLINPDALESRRCFFIRTEGTFSDYSKSLGRNLRHDVEKRQRRLNEAGGFEIKFTQDIPFSTFLDAITSIHSKRQADVGRRSFFQLEEEGALVREILSAYHQRGWVSYVAMAIDDQIAAYRLGFQYGGVVYDWNTGFDPRYNNFSVGKVLLHEWLRDLFRRPDVKEFNFMRGESDFKKLFAGEFRLNRDFCVRHPRSLYAKGINLAETIWRAAATRGRKNAEPSEKATLLDEQVRWPAMK